MLYSHLPNSELRRELLRRKLDSTGPKSDLVLRLEVDEIERGGEALTISMEPISWTASPLDLRSAAYGVEIHPCTLIGETVTHWSLNGFSPTLNLYLESGRTVTLEGAQMRHANVGLDNNLRDTLTLLNHEEDGTFITGIEPNQPIKIVEAAVARRMSIAAKLQLASISSGKATYRMPGIWQEQHMVVGLRLEGMEKMGYVYSLDRQMDDVSRCWGDVTLRCSFIGR